MQLSSVGLPYPKLTKLTKLVSVLWAFGLHQMREIVIEIVGFVSYMF